MLTRRFGFILLVRLSYSGFCLGIIYQPTSTCESSLRSKKSYVSQQELSNSAHNALLPVAYTQLQDLKTKDGPL